MTVQEMWEDYRQATGALEEDKVIFYAGAEAVVARVIMECENPATRVKFDPRRVAISLDSTITECVLYRRSRPEPLAVAGKPS